MNNIPLFTFSILAYNNFRYFFETLDSLFIQDYPNIELIISNDGSTDFDEAKVRSYIQKNAPGSIKSFFIGNHQTNHGTVQSVEWCRIHAHGEYIMYMAADDALDNPKVLSAFVTEFEKLGPEAMILCGRTEMCGADLDTAMYSVPSEEEIALIRNGDCRHQYSFLSHDFIFPTTGTCYRTAVYAITGGYDVSYRLIEDYSFFARVARMGIPFRWLDGLTVSRHRDGGISHGNVSGSAKALQDYLRDEKLLFEKEFLPYTDIIFPVDLKKFQRKLYIVRGRYFIFYEYRNLPFAKKIQKLPLFLFFQTREKLKGPYYFLCGICSSKGRNVNKVEEYEE